MKNLRQLSETPLLKLTKDELSYLNNNGYLNDIKNIIVPQQQSQGVYKVGTHTLVGASGSVAITGVGFTPKYIRIQSSFNGGGLNIYSDCSTDGGTTYGVRSYNNGTNTLTIPTTKIVDIEDTVSNINQATFTSFGADGFTINVSSNPSNITLVYHCFG